ncbi:Uncharacterised protein [Staphylococcus aureus]|nr:Uncharacterised protein [Staphylococcus aureus]
MENFNYNNIKKLVLENVDIDKVKEVYKEVKSRLLCKMLYNVFTISTYQN